MGNTNTKTPVDPDRLEDLEARMVRAEAELALVGSTLDIISSQIRSRVTYGDMRKTLQKAGLDVAQRSLEAKP
jgi:hypothetical protein